MVVVISVRVEQNANKTNKDKFCSKIAAIANVIKQLTKTFTFLYEKVQFYLELQITIRSELSSKANGIKR